MFKKIISAVVTVGMLASFCAFPVSADGEPSIDVSLSNDSPAVGETIDVTVSVTGMSAGITGISFESSAIISDVTPVPDTRLKSNSKVIYMDGSSATITMKATQTSAGAFYFNAVVLDADGNKDEMTKEGIVYSANVTLEGVSTATVGDNVTLTLKSNKLDEYGLIGFKISAPDGLSYDVSNNLASLSNENGFIWVSASDELSDGTIGTISFTADEARAYAFEVDAVVRGYGTIGHASKTVTVSAAPVVTEPDPTTEPPDTTEPPNTTTPPNTTAPKGGNGGGGGGGATPAEPNDDVASPNGEGGVAPSPSDNVKKTSDTKSVLKDAAFKFEGNFADLAKVTLNGKLLTSEVVSASKWNLSGYGSYSGVLGTATEGSVIVTLYKDFLATLPNGTYTLSVEFKDASTGAIDFVLTNGAITLPSDSNPSAGVALAVIPALAAMVATGAGLVSRKKRK